MFKTNLILMSLAMVLATTACSNKTSKKTDDEIQKIMDENDRKIDEIIAKHSLLDAGGQPGSIKVTGVVVKEDGTTTDERITVQVKTGTGKDGTAPALGEKSQPVLSPKNEKLELTTESEDKSLISLGCDEKLVAEMAKERSLEIKAVPAPQGKSLLHISANTVVLCKKMDDVANKYAYLTIYADELILDQVDYVQDSAIGFTIFNANKLLLLGSSTVATKGIDASMVLSLVSSLEFNILKEISSNEDGKLLLMSTGANYIPEKK